MKACLFIVISFWSFVLSACPQNEKIQVVSYNVHSSEWMEFSKYWTFRRAAIQDFIAATPADIYSFQEMDAAEAADIAEVLPQHTLIQQAHNLTVFYRSQTWELVHSTRWRDSRAMSAGRLVLRPKGDKRLPALELWNVWMNADLLQSEPIWALAEILSGTTSTPSLVSLSLKADDALTHNAKTFGLILDQWQLQHTAPEIFHITSNGWWAERKFTADWHDALLPQKGWTLAHAERMKNRVDGSYPSTHFPLRADYCTGGQGSDLWAARSFL